MCFGQGDLKRDAPRIVFQQFPQDVFCLLVLPGFVIGHGQAIADGIVALGVVPVQVGLEGFDRNLRGLGVVHLQPAAHKVVFLAIPHPFVGVLFGPVAGVGYPALGKRVRGKVFRQPVTLQAVLAHHDLEHFRHAPRIHAGAGQDVQAHTVSFLFVGSAVGQHVLHGDSLGAGNGGNADV